MAHFQPPFAGRERVSHRKGLAMDATSRQLPPVPAAPKFYSPRELYLKFEKSIGLNTIYRLVGEGRIYSVRLGRGKILIPASELHNWPERELRGGT